MRLREESVLLGEYLRFECCREETWGSPAPASIEPRHGFCSGNIVQTDCILENYRILHNSSSLPE